MNWEVRKVRDTYVVTQLDDGSNVKQEAEQLLRTYGCETIVHTRQSDIRNDQCWLQSVGYTFEAK